MQPVRGHISMILEKSLLVLRQLIPTILIMGISLRQAGIGWIAAGILLLLILTAVYLLFLWRNTWLYTQEDQLVMRTGVFWKKQLAIPFEKINTVDLSRNIIQRILGTCRLKIDTGVVKGAKSGSEVDLIFSLDQASKIRSHILQLASISKQPESADTSTKPAVDDGDVNTLPVMQDSEYIHGDYTITHTDRSAAADFFGVDELEAEVSEDGSLPPSIRAEFVVNSRQLIFFSLTRNKIAAGFLVLVSMLAVFDDIIGNWLIDPAAQFLESSWQVISSQATLMLAAVSLLIIAGYYIIANLISLILTFVRYFHFRVRRSSNHVYIRYGLLTEKNFSLPVRNVHAVVIRQNLIRRCLKQASVEIESIGYGDDDKEVSLLFPLIKLSELTSLLNEILPEYSSSVVLEQAPRRALPRFLFIPTLFASAIIIIPSLLFYRPALWLLAAALPLLWSGRYLSYKNSAVGYNSQLVEIQNGGFHLSRFRIRIEAVQQVSSISHPLMERSGLSHYQLDYHAPVLRTSVTARFLDKRHLDLLRSLLEES